MPNRLTGLDVSVFTADSTSYLGDLQNITFRETNTTQEGKGIAEIGNWPVLTGSSWEITGDLQVLGTTTMVLMSKATGLTPVVAITLNNGSNSYSGTAVITSMEHRMEREGIQILAMTLSGRGRITFS